MRYTWLLIITILFLVSCGVFPTPTIQEFSTPTISTPTITTTITFTPTQKPTPTITPSPTPNLPFLENTPIPEVNQVIGVDNASKIRELARWGTGILWSYAITEQAHIIAISTYYQIRIYNAINLNLISVIDTKSIIKNIKISADGKYVTSIHRDEINVWEAYTGKKVIISKTDTDTESPFCYSPVSHIFLASQGYSFKLVNLETGEQKLPNNYLLPSYLTQCEFSMNQKYVATVTTNFDIQIWDVETIQQIGKYKNDSEIKAIRFSPDERLFISASKSGKIVVWDMLNVKEITHFSNGYVGNGYGLLISNSGDRLLTFGSSDKFNALWELPKGKLIKYLKGDIYGASFSQNGEFFATSIHKGMIIRKAVSGDKIQEFNVNDTSFENMFLPDNRVIAISLDKIRLLDLKQKSEIKKINTFNWEISSITISNNKKKLAYWTTNGHLYIQNINSGKPSKNENLIDKLVYSASYSPKDNFLLTNIDGENISIYNSDTDELINSFKIESTWGSINQVDYSPDGNIYVVVINSLFESRLKLFNTHTGELVSRSGNINNEKCVGMCISSAKIRYITFSPDGTKIITNSSDNSVKIFDIATWKRIYDLSNTSYAIYKTKYSPDGSRIFLTTNQRGVIKVIDSVTYQELPPLEFYGYQGANNSTASVAISPDRKLVAAGDKGGQIIIWDLPNLNYLTYLSNHLDNITGLLFSNDGKYLYSSSEDGTVRVWGVLLDKSSLGVNEGVPIVHSVKLRRDTSSGELIIYQDIFFSDKEGDVTHVDYIIVTADAEGLGTAGGDIRIPSDKQKSGAIAFGTWHCKNRVYSVTLRVTLTDSAGHKSQPYEYTMVCN